MTHQSRLAELRSLPVKRTVALPHSGFDAGSRLLKRFGGEAVHERYQYGGSVPEGYCQAMFVLLPDSLVEVEEYEDAPQANTFAQITTTTEARADELQAVIVEGVLEQRQAELSKLPVKRTVRLPQSGLAAGARVLKQFGGNDARCGMLERRHEYGGSVPEGYRVERVVVLRDALVDVEEYEDRPDDETWAHVYARNEAHADELEAALVRDETRQPRS